jgi:hypothetical protein
MSKRSETKRLFNAVSSASTCSATFDLADNSGFSIQISATEDCLSTSVFADEDVALATEVITEASHGYETGLKGTLSVQTGCAAAIPIACVSVCCNLFTLACHGLTEGERGRFTTSACDTLPSFCGCTISACTDYYVVVVSSSTFRIATSRANAVAACPTTVCITSAGAGCCVTHTFTPNGAIHTGLNTCAGGVFVIKADDCSYKLASSRANAIAGTALNITTLNSPASTTFTAAAADCTSATVAVTYSNDGSTYVADAVPFNITGACPSSDTFVVTCAGLSTIGNADGVHHKKLQVAIDVTDSQWTFTVDINSKD